MSDPKPYTREQVEAVERFYETEPKSDNAALRWKNVRDMELRWVETVREAWRESEDLRTQLEEADEAFRQRGRELSEALAAHHAAPAPASDQEGA